MNVTLTLKGSRWSRLRHRRLIKQLLKEMHAGRRQTISQGRKEGGGSVSSSQGSTVNVGAAAHLQEAVPAAQEVGSLHDGVGGEDQLVLAERRLVWTAVDCLRGPRREIRNRRNAHLAPRHPSASARTGNIIHGSSLTQLIAMSDRCVTEDAAVAAAPLAAHAHFLCTISISSLR